MASIDEDRTQLTYELAVYKEQISLIKQETERISLTSVDLSNALSTMENFKGEEEKVLVPIGGGSGPGGRGPVKIPIHPNSR